VFNSDPTTLKIVQSELGISKPKAMGKKKKKLKKVDSGKEPKLQSVTE